MVEFDGKLYERVDTLIFDNGISRVYHPILTPEERERRIEAFKDAARELWLDTERRKQSESRKD